MQEQIVYIEFVNKIKKICTFITHNYTFIFHPYIKKQYMKPLIFIKKCNVFG
jgi:hypothetical protein